MPCILALICVRFDKSMERDIEMDRELKYEGLLHSFVTVSLTNKRQPLQIRRKH